MPGIESSSAAKPLPFDSCRADMKGEFRVFLAMLVQCGPNGVARELVDLSEVGGIRQFNCPAVQRRRGLGLKPLHVGAQRFAALVGDQHGDIERPASKRFHGPSRARRHLVRHLGPASLSMQIICS